MASFEYVAQGAASGIETRGSVQAATEQAAISRLRSHNLRVVSIKEKVAPRDRTAGKRGHLVELGTFRRQLETVIDSGLAALNPWRTPPAVVANAPAERRAETKAFRDFAATFRVGPAVIRSESSPPLARSPLAVFLEMAPKLLGEVRKPLREVAAASDPVARKEALSKLGGGLRNLTGETAHSAMLPVWQMASALGGLVTQLADNPSNVTPSTLRTVAGGIDILARLCSPSLKADLMTNPPLRLLVVDDDPVCRTAVSLALKKALSPPDLAENAETALTLAAKQAYDVIFLDVLMPGMDGFEACTRIHDTVPNRSTPIVFITSLSDFQASAKAAIKGGADLVGKPFLKFEITVKALTFALRARLQPRARITGACDHAQGTAGQAGRTGVTPPANHPVGAMHAAANPGGAIGDLTTRVTDDPGIGRVLVHSIASGGLSPGQPTGAFFDSSSAQLGPLQDLVQSIFRTTDERAQQQMLADFCVRFHDWASRGDFGAGHPALRLSTALEGLVNKLLQNPANCTSSALLTLTTAVDLLPELCVPRVKPDLADNPPIRVLAVDDDPVACRAITCALQVTFQKLESVDTGEAALALATEMPFDVIFMDLLMPGMDGLTACSRIHETHQNPSTPVVFITNCSDFKARSQATISGGSAFIVKPFLAAEITVKALTYALRGRLQKLKTAENMTLLRKEEEPDRRTGRQNERPDKLSSVNTSSPKECSAPAPPSPDPAPGKPRETIFSNGDHPVPDHPPAPGLATALSARALAPLENLHRRLQTALPHAESAEHLEFLGDLYAAIHAVCAQAEKAELAAAFRLGSALESMLKKLLERRQSWSPSAAEAAATALDLLLYVCRTGANPDLAQPPVRVLVVEDDPVARRAISGTLQLAFGQPDSVESGEAALQRANEKAFDLIFLDVEMPGIDGFTTCSGIRQTQLNRLTPVIYVTSHDDQKSRAKAADSGGCGFIPKQVLASQLTLVALNFVLRGRLGRQFPTPEAPASLARRDPESMLPAPS